MITVHHLEHSRSQRVLWLLEELGLPYQVVRYARDPQTMLAPAALRAIHPLGKSPIITDGDVVVAESGAIVEYLVETYGEGALQPAVGTPERLRYRYWLHYAEGSAMPPLLLKLVFSRLAQAKMPWLVRPIARKISEGAQKNFIDPQLKQHLAFMEAEMVGRTWLCGEDFSAADVQMSFPLEAASARGGLDASYPQLSALLERMHARPAYRKALAQGGPYELMR
ncbi:glutathione S-transferase [Paraperlucidibaca baekdonensis]|uniref:glutathione transferase n=1 Tax=Paraperlucidibaca baekdonensis TaxID=748120 RepID=A0A3E0H5Z1_9GAMM|nr:glutathione S-transferase [Paraperlucidibaca baekdonensis]REH38805.1 glutathione S-transferase [Paraperlucidibaca baekdonensis]